MCGIVGYYSNEPTIEDKLFLVELVRQSKIRGLHSFGFSWVEKGEMKYKKFLELEKALDFCVNEVYDNVIYHNRYSTSGDWKQLENNQPVISGKSSLVFNGVISQATKEENEEVYSLDLELDNDGEIFLKQEDKLSFLKSMRGSFAGLWIEDGQIYFGRNKRRPAHYLIKNKSVFLASTRDIFKRSGLNEITELIEVEPKKIYKLDEICPD